MDELFDQIKKRRTIREFKDEKIDEETIEKIKDTIIHSNFHRYADVINNKGDR